MSRKNNYLQEELYQLIRSDEQIFEFIQEASLDGLWYWDLDNPENEWMNEKFWTVLGYDPEEKKHLVSEWQDIIFEDDLAIAISNFKRHCQDPSHPYDQTVRYHHRNGSTVWIRCRGMAIRDENNVAHRMLGAHSDITKQKEIEEKYRRNLKEMDKAYAVTKLALEESEKLFEMAPDANLKVDERGFIVKANERACQLFGYSKQQLEEMNVSGLMLKDHANQHHHNIIGYFETGGARRMGKDRGKLVALNSAGEQIYVEITLNLIDGPYGKNALATVRDVSKREALISSLKQKLEENKALAELTLIDPLTKVYNNRHFQQSIEKELAHSIRHKLPLTLMIIDIDFFKEINDQHGHAAGNQILVQLTTLIGHLIRLNDVFARVGGEEFAVILPQSDIDTGLAIADRIVFEVANHTFVINDQTALNITVSAGVSQAILKKDTTESLFKRTDSALYQSKHQGRNRVCKC